MSAPREEEWYKRKAESLRQLVTELVLGLEETGERLQEGRVFVEEATRAYMHHYAERMVAQNPSLTDAKSPLQALQEYFVFRIKTGNAEREDARFEDEGNGRFVVVHKSDACPFVGSCKRIAASGGEILCVPPIGAEETIRLATGIKVASKTLSVLENGECKWEMFPAEGDGQETSGAKRRGAAEREARAASDAWSRLEAQYQLLLETIADAIVVVDNEGRVTYVNPRACGVFGVPAEEAMGAAFETGGRLGRIGDLCVKAAAELGKWQGMLTIENRDGERVHNVYLTRFSPIFARDRSRIGTMIVLEDITREEMLRRKLTAQAESLERTVAEKTRELQEANAKLEILARTDGLTGLANRRTFEEILRVEVLRSTRYKHPTGVLMVDVDDFKQVNDKLGHQTGDLVLKFVASILSKSVRASDTVARWGGDEFILLLPQAGPTECKAVARRISENLLIENASQEVVPGLSVGLSVGWATDTGGTSEELVAQADKMMYESKAAKKAKVTRNGPGPR